MTSLRLILLACLALTLVVTSAAMAVNRIQTDSAGSIIICTGHGPIAVAVDADGQPIGPVHICPDCLQSTSEAIAPITSALCAVPIIVTVTVSRAFNVTNAQFPRHQRHARAPPLV